MNRVVSTATLNPGRKTQTDSSEQSEEEATSAVPLDDFPPFDIPVNLKMPSSLGGKLLTVKWTNLWTSHRDAG